MRFGSKIALAGTAIFSVIETVSAVVNATKEFEKNVRSKQIESSINAIANEFDRFKEDLNKVDINRVNTLLVNAAQTFNKSINDIALRGTVTFSNFLAYIETVFGGRTVEEFGQLSDIRRLAGANAARSAERGPNNLQILFRSIIPQLAQEQAEAGRALADNINRAIEERLRRGDAGADIVGSIDFKSLAESLANANVVIRQKILELENSGLDPAIIAKRRQEIIEEYGREQVRIKELIQIRTKETENATRSVNIFTSSLKRSFDNLSQSINAASLHMQSLENNINLISSAYSGQAKVLSTSIDTLTVLQNPRAFDANRVVSARSQIGGFLGGTQIASLAKPLLAAGDAIENTVMSTVNSILSTNASASDEIIGQKVSRALRDSLKNIGLPPDLADKLAQETGKELSKLRTQGQDKISFA